MARAESEAVKVRAEAEAEAIRAEGEAKAAAIRAEAEALSQNQSAVLARQVVEVLPELVEQWARGYEKVGNITVYGGDASSHLGGESAAAMASTFDTVRSATGLDITALLQGRMVGSGVVGDRRQLAAAQNSFHTEVAAAHGLQKAPARLAGASKEQAAALVLKKLHALSDPVLRSAAWPVVRNAIVTDPRPWLQALGIVCEAVKKPLKTMVQIFTSKGKGARKEKPIGFEAGKNASAGLNPIGFEGQEKQQSLCTVGFAAQTPPVTSLAPAPAPQPPAPIPTCSAAPGAPSPAPAHVESVRVRDSEYSAQQFDPDTGEFIRLPAPAPKRRDMADSLVQAALARRAAAQPTRTPP